MLNAAKDAGNGQRGPGDREPCNDMDGENGHEVSSVSRGHMQL